MAPEIEFQEQDLAGNEAEKNQILELISHLGKQINNLNAELNKKIMDEGKERKQSCNSLDREIKKCQDQIDLILGDLDNL